MKKQQTNLALVKSMMEHSQVGVLKQAFIIEAIRRYADQIIADTSDWGENSFISQEAWKVCAKECADSINQRSK